jgi:hypothetical protein
MTSYNNYVAGSGLDVVPIVVEDWYGGEVDTVA